jgi:iron(III) transport system ATP-binding protein
MTAPVLELAGVHLRYGAVEILAGVDLAIGPAELVALAGPSGAGKTSALRVALGLAAPHAGVVRIAGRVATDGPRIVIPPEQRGIGVVFQDLALWPHLTVHGNLAFVLHRLPREERDARIAAMLRAVALADKAARHPGELSGGERQRVAIARALVGEPRIVALDEPLANLDVVLARELLAMFAALLRERGVAALYVTHHPRELAVLSDRAAIIEAGAIAQVGTLAELRAQPATAFVRALVSAGAAPGS